MRSVPVWDEAGGRNGWQVGASSDYATKRVSDFLLLYSV